MEQLERGIIEWIAERSGNAELVEQLLQAKVVRRDYMRTGFFIFFEVPVNASLIHGKVRTVCPDIVSPDLAEPAGSGLFVRQGRIHYLELFARGGFFPEKLHDYRLVSPDQE